MISLEPATEGGANSPAEPPRGVIRVRLHSVASVGGKVAIGARLIGATVIFPPVLGGIVGFLANAVQPGVGRIVGGLVGAAFAALLLECLLWSIRYAAWLEDTTLVVRGTLITRRCDLATAARLELVSVAELPVPPVAGGMAMPSTVRRVPRLIAYDDAVGRRVALNLVHPATNTVLVTPKLGALIDAMLARPEQDPDGASARRVATALRSLAS